jgi:hypothetical protein
LSISSNYHHFLVMFLSIGILIYYVFSSFSLDTQIIIFHRCKDKFIISFGNYTIE